MKVFFEWNAVGNRVDRFFSSAAVIHPFSSRCIFDISLLFFFCNEDSNEIVSAGRQPHFMQLEPTTSSSEPSGLAGSAPCPPLCPRMAHSGLGAHAHTNTKVKSS